jgi:hypothetical protein
VGFLLPAAAFLAAIVLLVLQVEPVPTWFYVFAWYPSLVILDELAVRRGMRRVLSQPSLVVSLFGWSMVIWLVFEVANFRLDNWYYIYLPRNAVERWAGILISFATVGPAVVLAERALRALNVGTRWTGAPRGISNADLAGAIALGLLQLVLALAWPRTFFPLIWGAAFLLCEPYVLQRRPDLSLFGDVAQGKWGRIGRLMLGGLGIGLLWESYNYWARGKWVYTVPWLEGTKWFEMPPFGFIGFAFFALEAWSMYAALCAARVAFAIDGPNRVNPRRAVLAGSLAAVFSVGTLIGMERWTISSVVPAVAPASGGESLAWLRGIGVEHAAELRAVGVTDACILSRRDPDILWSAIHRSVAQKRPTPAEVRVWVAAARRECVDL